MNSFRSSTTGAPGVWVDSNSSATVIPFCQAGHRVRMCYSTLHNHGGPVRYALPPKNPDHTVVDVCHRGKR